MGEVFNPISRCLWAKLFHVGVGLKDRDLKFGDNVLSFNVESKLTRVTYPIFD